MTVFVGLNMSQAKTPVCILNERGLVTWRGGCGTSPRAIAETLARLQLPRHWFQDRT